MRKKNRLFLLVTIFLLGLALSAFAQSAEDAFKKAFPTLQFDMFNPTDIKGVFEVVIDGTNIIYFAADPGYLIVGEIWDRNRTNITANRINEVILSKAKAIPLDKAVKIGTGKNIAIEFTDPDCSYCRKASSFFSQRTDMTRYIFFLPLPMHGDAENKIKYVLCAQDKVKAYEEAMTGKLDDMKYAVCAKPEVSELLKAHKDIAAKMGITGTPFFIINNKAISGANFLQIEGALKLNNDVSKQK